MNNSSVSCIKAAYNTSTITLRDVEGDKKKAGAGGHNWATLILGDINTGTQSSRLGIGRKAHEFAV
jgi:hypothetical protein